MDSHLDIENYGPDSPTDYLRQQAQYLYEDCLTAGNPLALTQFLEQQILQSPPPVGLFQDIASDLQQRCLLLREHYFDTRESIVQVFSDAYNADITTLTPPSRFDQYHHLEAEALLQATWQLQLSGQEQTLLLKRVKASLTLCRQLNSDIELTMQLQALVQDWLGALQTSVARQEQSLAGFLLLEPSADETLEVLQ